MPAAEWLDYFTQNGIRVSPERDGIRVSLGMFNTRADIDRLIEAIRARNAPSIQARTAVLSKLG